MDPITYLNIAAGTTYTPPIFYDCVSGFYFCNCNFMICSNIMGCLDFYSINIDYFSRI